MHFCKLILADESLMLKHFYTIDISLFTQLTSFRYAGIRRIPDCALLVFAIAELVPTKVTAPHLLKRL